MAVNEISTYRECRGRFSQSLARFSAEKMAPTEWWFQFGKEVPNLQKWALRIVSQCVSSSGCERNWSAFALVHTKQRNRLLYGKLHKSVSVRYNLKLRAEEDQDTVKLNYRETEIDPCAMMMDTAMHDESNPMMEWLNEDEEHIIMDGSDAASAVFEEIRRLNSRMKASCVLEGRNIAGKGRGEEEEDEYIESEDDDDIDEANELMDIDNGDDGPSESDGGLPRQPEKYVHNHVENGIEVASDGSLVNRRSGRVGLAGSVRDVNSLYY